MACKTERWRALGQSVRRACDMLTDALFKDEKCPLRADGSSGRSVTDIEYAIAVLISDNQFADMKLNAENIMRIAQNGQLLEKLEAEHMQKVRKSWTKDVCLVSVLCGVSAG